MSEMVALVAKFGWPVALVGVFLYIVLKGEMNFRYPRK